MFNRFIYSHLIQTKHWGMVIQGVKRGGKEGPYIQFTTKLSLSDSGTLTHHTRGSQTESYPGKNKRSNLSKFEKQQFH